MENWTQLLEQAGLDQKDLAAALDKSPSVISALVNNVQGKAAAGKKLKKKALDYLNERIAASESVVGGRPKSELSGFALRDHPGKSDLEIWKARAKDAEAKLHNLRSGLRALLDLTTPNVSSGAVAEVLEQLVSGVEAEHGSTTKPAPTPKR